MVSLYIAEREETGLAEARAAQQDVVRGVHFLAAHQAESGRATQVGASGASVCRPSANMMQVLGLLIPVTGPELADVHRCLSVGQPGWCWQRRWEDRAVPSA